MKTVATTQKVEDFIASLNDVRQREDTEELVKIFSNITGEKPVMWGPSIIGFGSIHLTYASGRQLDWMQAGFSPRKGKLSLYVTFDAATLTSKYPKLGKYKISKGCIYISKLTDINKDELIRLIDSAYKAGYQNPKRSDGKEQAV